MALPGWEPRRVVEGGVDTLADLAREFIFQPIAEMRVDYAFSFANQWLDVAECLRSRGLLRRLHFEDLGTPRYGRTMSNANVIEEVEYKTARPGTVRFQVAEYMKAHATSPMLSVLAGSRRSSLRTASRPACPMLGGSTSGASRTATPPAWSRCSSGASRIPSRSSNWTEHSNWSPPQTHADGRSMVTISTACRRSLPAFGWAGFDPWPGPGDRQRYGSDEVEGDG